MLAITGQRAAARQETRHFRPTLLQVWVVSALLLVAVGLPRIIGFAPDDPDDYMRLAEVRDLLAGQSWWDVRQYRMDAPVGADMHWSRLVDIPIVAFLAIFRVFLAEPWASVAAMTVVPLLQLLIVLLLLRNLMKNLGASANAQFAALALPLFFPLLLSNFLPLRIDHHGWQAIGALAAASLIVRGKRIDAALAGVAVALMLTVSLEGLPMAAMIGAVLALRYWLDGDRGHEGYLAGLAISAPLFGLLTRPPEIFLRAICDVLSWPHFAAFAAAAALAFAGRFAPRQDRPFARLLALAPIPLAAAPIIVVPLGACAVNPFAGMDPLLRHWWLDRVGEGLPIAQQPLSIAAMLVWTGIIVIAGWATVVKGEGRTPRTIAWTSLALLALGAAAYSLLVMRAALTAQLLTVPFASVLVAHWLPRARALTATVPRIGATLACLVLATPMAASAALKPFDRPAADAIGSGPAAVHPATAPTTAATTARAGADCEIAKLASLPLSKLFAPLDLGPEILARTEHGVVMSGYHRNQLRMRQVMEAFGGPESEARAIVKANGTPLFVACARPDKLAPYAALGPDNLAGRIMSGKIPDWLEPVPGFEEGSLKVYKVR